MEQDMLEPLKIYNKELKQKYKDTANKIFDELVDEAKTDVPLNRKTVASYNLACSNLNKAKRKLTSKKAIKVLLIIFICIAFVVAILMIILGCTNSEMLIAGIVTGIALILLGVGAILLICLNINKSIKALKKLTENFGIEVAKLKSECDVQMATLNALFDWNMPAKILNEASPLIHLDKFFDPAQFAYLHDRYGFEDNNNEDMSSDFVLSGDIYGNPFLVQRFFIHETVKITYTGSIVISWVETETDSKGNVRTVTRTQTLTAQVQHDGPKYYYSTRLVYGNDSAPHLHFSRSPSGMSGMNEKQIDRKVKKGEKKLTKKAERELMDNDSSTNFTMMGNEDFDVIFGAINRDNETEFRLLFTPLAQSSIIDLIINGKPYGDDFVFQKDGPINYITSSHAQVQDIYAAPANYMSYSVDISREQFVDYNTTFIQSLYFDLAPLLSIPLYQQNKAEKYIYNGLSEYNTTSYEDEAIANRFSRDYFQPKNCITDLILKVDQKQKVGNSDVVTIKSYGYRGENRTDFVSVFGGDGRTHQVPVNWIEYFPVTKKTNIAVRNCNQSRSNVNNNLNSNVQYSSFLGKYSQSTLFQRGLMAFVLINMISPVDDANMETLFNKK